MVTYGYIPYQKFEVVVSVSGSGYKFVVSGVYMKRVNAVIETLRRIPGQTEHSPVINQGEGEWGRCWVMFFPQSSNPKDIAEMVLEVAKWFEGHPEMFEPPGEPTDAPKCKDCGEKMRPAGSMFVCEHCGSTARGPVPPDEPDEWDGGDFGGDPTRPPQAPSPGNLSASAEVPTS